MPNAYRASAEVSAIREHVLAHSVATRGGVFRRSDLRTWGVDPGVIDAMLRRRWWTRLHHGVFVDTATLEAAASPQERHRIHAAATLAAIAGPAHLFATSAALQHGLPFDRDLLGPVHILRPLGHDSRALRRRLTATDRLEPALFHQHDLADDDVATIDGLSTVMRPLAALSTAALAQADWAVVTLDAVCWQSPDTLDRLALLAEEWGRLRGIGTVRQVLPQVRCGAQTPLETLSRLRLMRGGLPEPRLQVPLHDDEGLIGYADMLWDDLGIVGEADGALKYSFGQVVFDEKLREDRIRALGYIVVRWTWDEIMRDPNRVAARILAAAAIQRRHHGWGGTTTRIQALRA